MPDFASLQSWIQPQHLAEGALREYRDAFVADPARLLVLKQFLQPAVAERLSTFLTNEAEFAVERGLYSIEGPVNETQWTAAPEDDRFFALSKLTGTAPQFQMSRNALTYVQFRRAFQRDDFRLFFEAVSGLSLGWSDDFGSHAMHAGDFLRPHSDDNRNRQLALVIYLSPAWTSDMGGVLHMVGPEGQDTPVPPEFNSIVLFDVLAGTTHYVTSVSPRAATRSRLTIGGWYHRTQP
jgi:hypothetical protein